jgi:ribosomal protein L16
MMQPKKTKFRKAHKGRIHGVATSGAALSFGQFGLKAMAPERITARQIEAARRALTRHMKRAGRVWIRIFPDVPVSKKPAEVGGAGETGPRDFRNRRRHRADRERSPVARRRQTADQDALRRAHCGIRM